MRWIEGTISTSSGEIDDLCGRLGLLGAEGICVENEADFLSFLENNRQYWDYVDETLSARYAGLSRIKFYLSDDETGIKLLEDIKRALDREIEISYVDDEDWANGWQRNFQPIPVGNRLLIVPSWLDPDPAGRIPLRLEPGLAFGTGSHPTTQMCLRALDGLDLKGKNVLDLGCGSGILAIGALVLGCDKAAGCDVDPKAPDAARANAALNGIGEDRFQVYAGDILKNQRLQKQLAGEYDVVLANIVADVIERLSPMVRRFMTRDGLFIASGIIDERAEGTAKALEKSGLKIKEHLRQEEWHCYVSRK